MFKEEKYIVSNKRFWIFGYGSLIWNPNVLFLRSENAFVQGWKRQFVQGSPDHRGVPERPGCVVTIVPDQQGRCYGRLYQIERKEYNRVFAYLDVRECKGYRRLTLDVQTLSGEEMEAFTYVATEENPYYLSDWSIEDIANRIREAHGPSGSNLEYFNKLRESLATFAPRDEHIEELARHIFPFDSSGSSPG